MSQSTAVEVRDTLAEITADDWNRLTTDGNPFLRYEFLFALEQTGCLGPEKGWFPRYFLVFDDTDLIAACATYVKTNSYGEFVFDWAWAEAYERHGLTYYPKLVASIPYTPATGQRLLVRDDQDREALSLALANTIVSFCEQENYSSVHWLFVTLPEQALMDNAGFMTRKDSQYHWHNRGYTSFEHFLENCTAKRRKTLRRERRYVTDANLRLERRLGSTLTDTEWGYVHAFYSATFDRKWGSPSLTLDFFRTIGHTMGDRCLIVFAYNDSPSPIACSIMFIGDSTLYGRFWGCSEEHHCLHFEACYYQGIEYCIEHGIEHFEPGAQGEHKITRGFEPTLTYSCHWIAHEGFRDAIQRYLDMETPQVEARNEGLQTLLPFRQGD